jgi:hypothetical protein
MIVGEVAGGESPARHLHLVRLYVAAVTEDLFVDWAVGCVHPFVSPDDQQNRHAEIKSALSTTPHIRAAIGETLRVVASLTQPPQPAVASWFPKLRATYAPRVRKAELVERPSEKAIRLADWALHARLGDGANWSSELDDAAACLRL